MSFFKKLFKGIGKFGKILAKIDLLIELFTNVKAALEADLAEHKQDIKDIKAEIQKIIK
jgi:hypothetical protein